MKNGTFTDLLTIDRDTKTSKSVQFGYLTAIQYLAPSDASGDYNTCKHAGMCRFICLNTSGRLKLTIAEKAQIARTIFMFQNMQTKYIELLIKEHHKFFRMALKRDLISCSRLNGLSDMPYENIYFKNYDNKNIMEIFNNHIWYDYTKYPYNERPNEKLPSNYHLTYSYSEKTTQSEFDNLPNRNMAVVFDLCKQNYKSECALTCKCDMVKTWNSYKVIDGDITDLRFLDPPNRIIGLRAKGDARTNPNDFIVKVSV